MLAAMAGPCEESDQPEGRLDPEPGQSVKLRGTLGEDVDCRTFRDEAGKVYSLSTRLRGYPNGTKLCIYATVSASGGCMATPTLDVQSIRTWSSCP